MEDVGGAHAVRTLQPQSQPYRGLSVRAGLDDLAVIILDLQFLKPSLCRFKREEVFQWTTVFGVVRPGCQIGDDVKAPPAAG